jgi:hypothetical protein
MIPVVVGGIRETSLFPEDLPPLTKKIIYYQVCLVRGGKSSGNKLVSLNPPATTEIIRPRKDNILSGMFSKGR